MEKQITSVTIFKSKSLASNFWAFQQVPLAVYRLQKVPGLTFFKSMGSGGGKGFDFMPSFSTYAWLLVWESQQHADDFYFNNPYFLKYQKKCASVQTLYLKNLVSHGISSFDGITITNGYHPLWFICNVILYTTSGMNDGREDWLRDVMDESLAAVEQGMDLHGICLFPAVDMPDWHTGKW